MQFVHKCVFVVLLLLSIVSLVAAQDACPAEVDDAVIAMSSACSNVSRNQACYGNGEIVAIPQADTTLNFELPGDLAEVDDIASLTLSPFASALEEWGIAVLVLQADLPDTLPGQNVTMLLFGDVSLSNESGAYYFSGGIGAPDCNTAPNGMLIQTPDGVGEVNLTMNGVNISIGSTAYITTSDVDELLFALIEGSTTLSIDDSEIALEPDQFTTIALDEDGNAIGEFTEPQTLEEDQLPVLPYVLLPESPVESDEPVLSGETIIPSSGDWLFTLDLFDFVGNCPDMFNEAMVREGLESFGFSETVTQEVTFDADEFDLDNIFDTSEIVAAGLDYTYSNPEPNVYVIELGIPEAGAVTYTWRVVSQDRIEGEILQNLVIPDFADCTITTTFLMERQG